MIDLDNIYAAWAVACEKQEWAEFKNALRRKIHNDIELKWTPTTLTINGTLVLTAEKGVIPAWLTLGEEWMESLNSETVEGLSKYIEGGAIKSHGNGTFTVLKTGTLQIPGIEPSVICTASNDTLNITTS